MNPKMINGIPVNDDVFNKMALLQERLRRIDAESRLLLLEKAETTREVNALLASIDPPKTDVKLAEIVPVSPNAS